MVLVQMEKYSQSCLDVWHVFIHDEPHMLQVACLSACFIKPEAPLLVRYTFISGTTIKEKVLPNEQ